VENFGIRFSTLLKNKEKKEKLFWKNCSYRVGFLFEIWVYSQSIFWCKKKCGKNAFYPRPLRVYPPDIGG
jgi:hypothetical protein